MSKSRMMGAGNASASLYKTNPNINTFGGSKKQDIPTRVGIDAWANYGYQTSANGIGRNKLFIMNQIGGVGVGRSMFNTSYVQPRGLRKIIDISDIAYWDGVQHVLKKDVTIPSGHSLTTTSTFTVGQGTTLTVLGNFQSQGHIIVQGVLNILGNHDHKKMTIEPTGSYNVSGSAYSSNKSILKTVIDDTETDVADVTNQGIFNVQNGGSYTNVFTFTNGVPVKKQQGPIFIPTISSPNLSVIFTIDEGGQFINSDTFINYYGSTFNMNGTYQNDGSFKHKTTMTEINGIMGTFINYGTLTLSIDNNYYGLIAECSMYLVEPSTLTNWGTITIDSECHFYSCITWTNSGIVDNSGTIFINPDNQIVNDADFKNKNIIEIYKGSFANWYNATFTNEGTFIYTLPCCFANYGTSNYQSPYPCYD
jgi:hypothetical protein